MIYIQSNLSKFLYKKYAIYNPLTYILLIYFANFASNQFANLQERPGNLHDMRTNIQTLQNIYPTLLSEYYYIHPPELERERERLLLPLSYHLVLR